MDTAVVKTGTSEVSPAPPTLFRWIVERSCMRNNDEWVVFSDREISAEAFRESPERREFYPNAFSSPHLVACRPVFSQELAAGLNTTYIGETYGEKAPEITRALDGVFRLLGSFKWMSEAFVAEARTPTSLVSEAVASNYYDCMSGGMDSAAVWCCRRLVEMYGCDLHEPVYPSSENLGSSVDTETEGWYTLGDWMKETADVDERLGAAMFPIFGELKARGLLPAEGSVL